MGLWLGGIVVALRSVQTKQDTAGEILPVAGGEGCLGNSAALRPYIFHSTFTLPYNLYMICYYPHLPQNFAMRHQPNAMHHQVVNII